MTRRRSVGIITTLPHGYFSKDNATINEKYPTHQNRKRLILKRGKHVAHNTHHLHKHGKHETRNAISLLKDDPNTVNAHLKHGIATLKRPKRIKRPYVTPKFTKK